MMIDSIVDLVAGRMGKDSQFGNDETQGLHTRGKDNYDDNERDGCGPNEHNAGSVEDRIHDDLYMAQVEKRVASYLERIQQTQSSGRFQRIRDETQRKDNATSWEQLHIAQTHNRHVYFAGMPLSHSKEVVQMKRNEERIVKQAEELVEELRKRDEHIEELVRKQNVDFRTFEVAIGKAMGLGMGCHLLLATVERQIGLSKGYFFKAARLKQVERMHKALESHEAKLKESSKVATRVIARSIHNLLKLTLKEAMHDMRVILPKLLKNNHTTSVEPIQAKQYAMTCQAGKLEIEPAMRRKNGNQRKHDHRFGDVEETVLTRLESLVAQEMQILANTQINI